MANNAKGNFNQAMYSMFGVGKEPEAAKNEPAAAKAPAADSTPAPDTAIQKDAAPAAVRVRTHIAEGTTLEGNLHSTGDVEISGILKGNVKADGEVIVRSSLTGNITAETLQIINCTVTGDIHVSGRLVLDKGSAIIGNVFSKEFICSGQVKGDLHIDGLLSLKESSKVEGNITTGSMEMSSGAVFSGQVEMSAAKKSN